MKQSPKEKTFLTAEITKLAKKGYTFGMTATALNKPYITTYKTICRLGLRDLFDEAVAKQKRETAIRLHKEKKIGWKNVLDRRRRS